MSGRYDDIINLPHHVSAAHSHMPMSDRAAQFSPFAALSGYGDAVKETARVTTEQVELAEDVKAALEMKIRFLADTIPDGPTVDITYFQPDKKKSGGTYVTASGSVKRIDDIERAITMHNGLKIAFTDIITVDFH